jgi:2-C-methyl-D-erythritol 4-phosphate cytidylyltransferase
MNIAAIIPVAGKGKRFGEDIPKQYFKIDGSPVITITLNKIQAVNEINSIIIVVSSEEIDRINKIVHEYCDLTKDIKIVAGGPKRQDSVYNGLLSVNTNTDIVVVHDGVRPLIQSDTISRSIEIASKHGSCVVAVPAKDTIKKVVDKKVIETLPRDHLVQVQTPQTFKYHILKEAHDKAKEANYYATDESALVEWAGYRVTVLQGSYDNIKITTKNDLKIAEVLMSLNRKR